MWGGCPAKVHPLMKVYRHVRPGGSREPGKDWNLLYDMQMDTTVMAESKEELKSLLIKVKEESEKVGLKLNILKTKIMASGPITSWQIDGEKWKQ